jgi:peptidyl-prolyl cis-trans isomerase SurA
MPIMSSFRTALKLHTAVACAGLLVLSGSAFAQNATPDTGDAALASAPALGPDSQAPQLPALGEGILMSVNKDMVTSYDLKQRMLLLMVTSGVQVTQENYASFQQQAVSSLVEERLQKQEMEHWKVKVEDKEIDEEIERMGRQSGMNGTQLLAELKKLGIEPQTLREQIKAQTGWSMLVGGRYRSNAAVGKAQVEATMDKVVADGQKPQYYVAEIFIDPAQAGSLAAAQAGAQQLYTQMQSKVAPFQAVARQFSHAPSAAQGGDAGWLVSGNIDPQVEAALSAAKPGDMLPPITTKDGVYIYLLRQKSDGNADMVFHIKQAAVPLTANASAADVSRAEATLNSIRTKARTCDAVDEIKTSGVQVSNLGEAQLSMLKPTYADALRPLKANQTTPPMRNDQNMNVLFVCDRQLAGENAVTRDQIQSSLVNERISMLGKRYLRQIRAGATIENHQ